MGKPFGLKQFRQSSAEKSSQLDQTALRWASMVQRAQACQPHVEEVCQRETIKVESPP